MSQRDFGPEEIRVFLSAVDRHLTARARLEIIGGCAAALAYGATSTTEDIDTFNITTEAVIAAVALAQEQTGLAIPVRRSPVADPPYGYDLRLQRVLAELHLLEVYVLEKHDLAHREADLVRILWQTSNAAWRSEVLGLAPLLTMPAAFKLTVWQTDALHAAVPRATISGCGEP